MYRKCLSYQIAALLLLFPLLAQAQYFGRNKPAYTKFEFQVLHSPHFEFYHYFNDPQDAVKLVQDAEKWYSMHQAVLKDTFSTRNPIIMYKNHADFQQTTAISGEIGVGTGGVTEGLKNRVVMPVTLSNRQTDHVLGHELVHAFQYHMMRTGDSTNLYSIQNLPLWMVEGLAEYMSLGSVDPNTAMWMRDAVIKDDIPTIKDLTRKPRYFPYRWGEALWSFIGGSFGDDKIAPLFEATGKNGFERATETILGVDAETLGNMWKTSLQNYYKPYIAQTDTIATGTKLLHPENAGTMNISPVISPNGRYIAYLSEQNVLSLDLFLADARTGKVIKQLANTIRYEHLDNFNFLESAGTWSPGGNKFAFVVFSRGRNRLAIVDVARSHVLEVLDVPGVVAFSYPAWSPDGSSIVVAGLVEGRSDLYLYNLKTKKTTQLTKDNYSDVMPYWSADGSRIIFSTDRPAPGQGNSNKGRFNLAELTIATGHIQLFDVFAGADNLNPVYAPNSDDILFLSDRDGYRNMYRLNRADNTVQRLTNYATGISGITALSPAMSVARDEATVVYSHYQRGNYSIYSSPLAAFKAQTVPSDSIDFRAAVLPPQSRVKPLVDQQLAQMYNTASPVKPDQINAVAYRPQFKLDMINGSAGVGVQTAGPIRSGLQGGVNMLFNDIVGNNQIFGAVSLNGEIYDFGAMAAYLRQTGKIQWGASLSHIPYLSARIGSRSDTLQTAEGGVPVDNLILQQIRTYQDQIALMGNYILNTTHRFEFGGGISHYSYRIDQFNNYYTNGFYIRTDREKIDAPDGFMFEQLYAAYVGDNSRFGLTSPLAGRRYRLHVERYFGEFKVYNLLADYRQYVRVKPFTLAFRALHHARYGPDAESGRLAPLTIIYPFYIRGFGNEYFIRSQEQGNPISFNNLYGTRIAVANMEIRLPFTGPERLTQIKSGFLFSDLNLFVDGGLAWSEHRLFNETEFSGQFGREIEYRPLISTGVSARINLFGAIIVEPFYAIPLEKNGMKLANFGINIGPGW
ncbi:PD40 domain-containing protein [Pontibacter sp. BT310]|uniref:PD40 domain-containing protein n=1 Tax=Pontibacter populi TaxID=890055 RepID=A0ABS6X6X8_9BACT|nr:MULTISPECIES: PD40 domain-containing protein [Pontibacter]MBJ6116773.1 PD40 domain-containing protein [Pontibacter sp. BT310]MBR0569195.1 PD40 domain-containing protein [Microvirga sp. STS03]MBW3363626.1 PD40 domain-containing protein [Pontibacter populi]